MNIMDYIKPELLSVALAVYFVGLALKTSNKKKNYLIPFINMLCSVVLCVLYVLSTSQLTVWQDALMAAFVAIVQGILCAGLATYCDQLIKQAKEGAKNERD